MREEIWVGIGHKGKISKSMRIEEWLFRVLKLGMMNDLSDYSTLPQTMLKHLSTPRPPPVPPPLAARSPSCAYQAVPTPNQNRAKPASCILLGDLLVPYWLYAK